MRRSVSGKRFCQLLGQHFPGWSYIGPCQCLVPASTDLHCKILILHQSLLWAVSSQVDISPEHSFHSDPTGENTSMHAIAALRRRWQYLCWDCWGFFRLLVTKQPRNYPDFHCLWEHVSWTNMPMESDTACDAVTVVETIRTQHAVELWWVLYTSVCPGYVKIRPITFNGAVAMRAGLVTCGAMRGGISTNYASTAGWNERGGGYI